MRFLGMMLMVAVMVLSLLWPASSFAMGGRHGGGSGATHHGFTGKNQKSSDKDHDSGNEDDDDVDGNAFFDNNDEKDPFIGIFNHQKDQEEKEGSGREEEQFSQKDEENDVQDWEYSGLSCDGDYQRIPSNTNVVPEPATLSLMLLGGAGLGLIRRRQSNQV